MEGITQVITAAKKNFDRKLYFREDFERLILEIEDSIKKGNTDTETFARIKLEKMFAAHGIKLSKKLTPKQLLKMVEANAIPSISTFSAQCWEELAKFNIAYKSPKDYMERLVNNLVDPKYNTPDTPIRVKILKQFLDKMNFLDKTAFCDKKVNDVIEKEYNGVISDIDDKIFEKHLTSGHCKKDHKLLRVILDVYGDVLYRDGEYDGKLTFLMLKFFGMLNDNETPKSGRTVKGIKTFECKKTFEFKKCGMTAKELVSFIKENNPKITVNEKGKESLTFVLKELDEELLSSIKSHFDTVLERYKNHYDKAIWDIEEIKDRKKQFESIVSFLMAENLLNRVISEEFYNLVEEKTKLWVNRKLSACELFKDLNSKAEKKPSSFSKINTYIIKCIRDFRKETNKKFRKGNDNIKDKVEDFEILRICNDLAEGIFKKDADMKERLYLFAFAFDMAVLPEAIGKNRFRDVKKNLFEDFYCDNIIRYVNNYHLTGACDEPTGMTIQYKNFVEIVYLYWLNKDNEVIPPYDRYLRANKMIKDIVTKAKRALADIENSDNAQGILEKKEKGTFIYRSYFEGNKLYKEETANIFKMDEKTFEEFIIKNYDIDIDINYNIKNFEGFENESYQEQAEDMFNYIKKEMKTSEDYSADDSWYPLFLYDILKKKDEKSENGKTANDCNGQLWSLIEKVNEQMLEVLRAEEYEIIPTRTKYMYLYYSWFIGTRIDNDYKETFDDFCAEYFEQLNIDLETCSYQPFSEKNLIDVMLLYSAFIILRT